MATIKSIEEKARRYDEVFSIAKEWYNNPNSSSIGKSYLYAVLPELKESKESEDEKIMGAFRDFAENYLFWGKFGLTKEKALAWLEKQGKQKHICKLDNSYARVKFPFKAKVKSSGTIVTIHDGQLSSNGKEWIKYQSDKEDGYKIYEPNNLELVCEIEQKPADTEKGTNGNKREFPFTEQKPLVWSKEDDAGFADVMWAIQKARTIAKDENDMGNLWYAEHFLNSIKGRVQPQPKQEWSEEDEKIYNLLYEEYKNIAYYSRSREKVEDIPGEVLGWLKSLKERYTWKPSDKQMITLEYYMHTLVRNSYKVALFSLYHDLLKLRKE